MFPGFESVSLVLCLMPFFFFSLSLSFLRRRFTNVCLDNICGYLVELQSLSPSAALEEIIRNFKSLQAKLEKLHWGQFGLAYVTSNTCTNFPHSSFTRIWDWEEHSWCDNAVTWRKCWGAKKKNHPLMPFCICKLKYWNTQIYSYRSRSAWRVSVSAYRHDDRFLFGAVFYFRGPFCQNSQTFWTCSDKDVCKKNCV